MPVSLDELPRLLTCPACRDPGLLAADEERVEDRLTCSRCGTTYPIRDGIPILLPPSLLATAFGDDDDADALAHKRQQAAYTDEEADDEWEIRRPAGGPALYRWLFEEKFRRSVSALRPLLRGATVLTICGGSGLDAEFLARTGARVITSDISIGAARRARERGARTGTDLTPIVADAENLPFADATIDIVYVHDGLHHLEVPTVGLAEMLRVARTAVSVNEPARAAVTALAVRLGVALEREEAGNPVARLTSEEIIQHLERTGFRPVKSERYAMYYQHHPGPLMRAFSRPFAFPIARTAIVFFNRVAGRLGNKLTVQGVT